MRTHLANPAVVLATACATALAVAAPPAAAQAYTEVTAAAGVAGAFEVSPTDTPNWVLSGGVAVGDVDGDGWEDIVAPLGSAQPLRLYHNNANGTFTDVAAAAGLDVALPVGGPLLVDIDADGDLDLFLTMITNVVQGEVQKVGGLGPGGPVPTPDHSDIPAGTGLLAHDNRVYLNNGSGVFKLAPHANGLGHAGRYGAACGDLDADGDLDLVALTWESYRPQFMRNQGDGTFREATPIGIAVNKVWGFTPRLVDMDNDGDLDILAANDVHTSRFWRNTGGWHFLDDTFNMGLGTDENGMGSAIADVDRDGDLDWFISCIYSPVPIPLGGYYISGNRLFLNNGFGFSDSTTVSGLRDGGWGWGSQFADLDNDTDADLVLVNGWYSSVPGGVPQLLIFDHDTTRVYVNDGTGKFTDKAALFGLNENTQGRGMAVFDFDHDGALDVLTANNDVGLRLWRGSTAGLGHWLHVELRQTGKNRFAVGARVTVKVTGKPDQIAPMECGNNFLSQAPQSLWYGLGAATSATVVVRWPGGATSTHAVSADTRVVLVKP